MMLVLALGLLLWARLKLVTDTPRMVYADPKASAGLDAGALPAPEGVARPGPTAIPNAR
jgi:hypothetical protein